MENNLGKVRQYHDFVYILSHNLKKIKIKNKKLQGGACVGQLIKGPTLDFNSGHDLGVLKWSPESRLSAQLGVYLTFSPSPSALPPPTPPTHTCAHALSLSLRQIHLF